MPFKKKKGLCGWNFSPNLCDNILFVLFIVQKYACPCSFVLRGLLWTTNGPEYFKPTNKKQTLFWDLKLFLNISQNILNFFSRKYKHGWECSFGWFKAFNATVILHTERNPEIVIFGSKCNCRQFSGKVKKKIHFWLPKKRQISWGVQLF